MENINLPETDNNTEYRVTLELIKELWSKTYNTEGKPDWSHILPYYADDIVFRDSVQQINGLDDFKAMTERLSNRSKDLKMAVIRAALNDDIIFIEWEMTISYKKYPSSILYGCSRITIDKYGKIKEQRDYYDLWGDIFDNIPRFNKIYRRFMGKKFGWAFSKHKKSIFYGLQQTKHIYYSKIESYYEKIYLMYLRLFITHNE